MLYIDPMQTERGGLVLCVLLLGEGILSDSVYSKHYPLPHHLLIVCLTVLLILSRYASVNVNSRQRSQSVSAAEIRSSTRSTTLPRALPPPPINGANNVLNLPNSPPVYGRRGSAHSTGGVSRTSELRVGRENTTSQDSVLMDVSAFIRNAPFRSPSRQRKVQSMYVESVLNTRLEGANSRPPHTHSSSLAPQPLQGAGFPYDSPGSSPPPVPKRGVRPKSIAIESSSRTSQDAHKLTTPSPPILTSNANYRVNPTSSNHHHNRRLSQPHLDVAAPIVVPELPSNLDTCSRSSSSSALHPVSLADINRRSGSIPPSPGHTSTQLTTVRTKYIELSIMSGMIHVCTTLRVV